MRKNAFARKSIAAYRLLSRLCSCIYFHKGLSEKGGMAGKEKQRKQMPKGLKKVRAPRAPNDNNPGYAFASDAQPVGISPVRAS